MRLGFSVQRGMQLLPLVIPEFTQKYPYVRIELHEHGSDVLEQLLIEGVCDLALITTSPKRRELHYELLENEEIVLMADQNTNIAQRLPDGTTTENTACRSYAELTDAEKDAISHRGRAMLGLMQKMDELFHLHGLEVPEKAFFND